MNTTLHEGIFVYNIVHSPSVYLHSMPMNYLAMYVSGYSLKSNIYNENIHMIKEDALSFLHILKKGAGSIRVSKKTEIYLKRLHAFNTTEPLWGHEYENYLSRGHNII